MYIRRKRCSLTQMMVANGSATRTVVTLYSEILLQTSDSYLGDISERSNMECVQMFGID